MKKTILVSIITMISLSMFGQDTPQKLIDSFFNEFATSSNNAIDSLYKSNIWSLQFVSSIAKIKSVAAKFSPEFVGPYYGYTLIAQKQVGKCYRLYSYVLKFDRTLVRLTLKFYKPTDTWRIYSVKFDSNTPKEIEENAKLFNLNLNTDK